MGAPGIKEILPVAISITNCFLGYLYAEGITQPRARIGGAGIWIVNPSVGFCLLPNGWSWDLNR